MRPFVYQKGTNVPDVHYNKVEVSNLAEADSNIKLEIKVYSGTSLGIVIIDKKDIPEFCSRLAGLIPFKESNFRDLE